MAEKIIVPEHRDVMNAAIPHESQRFQQFLLHPAEYYYGIAPEKLSRWPVGERLHEAARRATRERNGVMNAHIEIPESAIYTVWRAIQYPREYALELGDRFPDGVELLMQSPLRDYIQHSRRYGSSHGTLYEGERVVERPKVERGVYGDEYIGPAEAENKPGLERDTGDGET
jgi:hypothetical protein